MEEANLKKSKTDNLNVNINSKDGVTVEDLSKLDDEFLREGYLILSDLLLKKTG